MVSSANFKVKAKRILGVLHWKRSLVLCQKNRNSSGNYSYFLLLHNNNNNTAKFLGLLCLYVHINGCTGQMSWHFMSSQGADILLTMDLDGDDVTMVPGYAHICRSLVGHNWVRVTAVFRVTGFQREFKGSAKAPGKSCRNGGCVQL